MNLDLLAYILKLRVPGWDSQYTQGAWGALRLIFLGLQKFFVNSVSMAILKRNFELLPPAMSFNNEGLIPQQPTNQPTGVSVHFGGWCWYRRLRETERNLQQCLYWLPGAVTDLESSFRRRRLAWRLTSKHFSPSLKGRQPVLPMFAPASCRGVSGFQGWAPVSRPTEAAHSPPPPARQV